MKLQRSWAWQRRQSLEVTDAAITCEGFGEYREVVLCIAVPRFAAELTQLVDGKIEIFLTSCSGVGMSVYDVDWHVLRSRLSGAFVVIVQQERHAVAITSSASRKRSQLTRTTRPRRSLRTLWSA